MMRLWVVVALACALLLCVPGGTALEYVVETARDEVIPNDECSLREAVILASGGPNSDCGESAPGPHTIVLDRLVTPVLYVTADPNLDVGDELAGDLDIRNVTLTIKSRNGRVAIDGLRRTRVFHVKRDAAVTFEGLEIRNGVAQGQDERSLTAGGILNSGDEVLHLRDVVFRHHNCEVASATGGLCGAAVASYGVVDMSDCLFELNEAIANFQGLRSIDGGPLENAAGVLAVGSVIARRSTFRRNLANYGPGAIHVVDNAVVNAFQCVFVDNHGEDGGAIRAADGHVTLFESELTGNSAGGAGGAVWARGEISFDGGAAFPPIAGNTADGSGGALYSETGAVLVRNTGNVVDNSAAAHGGVAWARGDATLSVVHGSVSRNTAAGGGGGALVAYRGSAELSYVSGEVAHNHAVYGGVLYSYRHVIMAGVAGRVSYNSAVQSGGVVYAQSSESNSIIDNVGSIESNTAAHGGVAYVLTTSANNGDLTISNVLGSVAYNSAEFSGGVAFSLGGGVRLEHVGGSVASNKAQVGGVFFLESRGGEQPRSADEQRTTGRFGAQVRYVDGDVSQNAARLHGGVVYSNARDNGVEIAYIGGNVTANAALSGGVVYATWGGASIHDLGGDLSYNTLFGDALFEYQYVQALGNYEYFPVSDSFGGVAFSRFGHVDIYVVKGSIEGNSAGSAGIGGVAYAFSGDVTIRDVEGRISLNTGVLGSIAYGANIEVHTVGGDISYNTGSALHTKGRYNGLLAFGNSENFENGNVLVSNVGGSILANVCVTPDFGAFSRFFESWDNYARADFFLNGGLASGHDVTIDTVGGDISYNACGAGVAFALSTGRIRNVGGDIAHNQSSYAGGVMLGFDEATIEGAGHIAYNSAPVGGVLASYSVARIANVGDVVGNTAYYNDEGRGSTQGSGGVIFAHDRAEIRSCGAIEHNTADQGGVIFSRGAALISHVEGDVAFNHARWRGGVVDAAVEGLVLVEYVGGGLLYNSAAVGGVIAAVDRYEGSHGGVVLRYVTGDIAHNSADGGQLGKGGVVAAFASVLVDGVGSIHRNFAVVYGGAFLSLDGDLTVRNVGGDVSYNVAFYGGFAYAEGNVRIEAVLGNVAYNSTLRTLLGSGTGGVACSPFGDVSIHVVGGDVWGNSSGFGGVAYAGGDVSLRDIHGSVSDNLASEGGGVIFSGLVLRGPGGVGKTEIANVGGHIARNQAIRFGAVVLSGTSVSITDVYGAIEKNSSVGPIVQGYGSLTVYNVGGVVFNATEFGGVFDCATAGPSGASVSVDYVAGDVSENTAEGVLNSRSGSASLTRVFGSVVNNHSFYYGGVVFALDRAELLDVEGEIEHNVALLGGVLYSVFGTGEIARVGGSVRFNRAAIEYSFDEAPNGGGVVRAGLRASISQVGGDVSNNTCIGNNVHGGVVFSQRGVAIVEQVGGSVAENRTSGHGGVLSAPFSSARVVQVGGDVRNNVAGLSGGVVHSFGAARVYDVAGAVERNRAGEDGGVARAGQYAYLGSVGGHVQYNAADGRGGVLASLNGGSAVVEDVAGGVSYNAAQLHGGVIASEGCQEHAAGFGPRSVDAAEGEQLPSAAAVTMAVRRVGGSVAHNTGGLTGGVVSSRGCPGEVEVAYVLGDVSYNTADGAQSEFLGGGNISYGGGVIWHLPEFVRGGEVRKGGNVRLSDVSGTVSHNSAVAEYNGQRAGYGGVIYSYGAEVEMARVGAGIYRNTAAYGGGVVFTYEAGAEVSDVDGDIKYNHADSGGVFYVLGAYDRFNQQVSGLDVRNVTGVIGANTALNGGVVANSWGRGTLHAAALLRFEGVAGGLVGNSAQDRGAVAYWRGPVIMSGVGPISHNACVYGEGGVVEAYEGVVLRDVGEITRNRCGSYGCFSSYYSVEVQQVNGDVAYNSVRAYRNFVTGDTRAVEGHEAPMRNAFSPGGVFSARGTVSVDDVRGSLSDNVGSTGAVAASFTGPLRISNVQGDICRNHADVGGAIFMGSVGFFYNSLEVVNVLGDICDNRAKYNGGFIGTDEFTSANVIRVDTVGGSITRNAAEYGSGGAVYVGGAETDDGVSVQISRVAGDVSFNTAALFGGAVHATGAVQLNVVGGHILDNSAGLSGGALYASTVVVREVGGDIRRCSAGEFGGFAYASASLNTLFGDPEGSGVEVDGVTGSITQCTAHTGGVVALANLSVFGPAPIQDTPSGIGQVINRRAPAEKRGNFATAVGVTLRNIGGDISYNLALGGYSLLGRVVDEPSGTKYGDYGGYGNGGVVYALADSFAATSVPVLIEEVDGSIIENEAEHSGGVVWSKYAQGDVVVRRVRGDVSFNKAWIGGGGVIAKDGGNSAGFSPAGHAEVVEVSGDICHNTAFTRGGVIEVLSPEGAPASGTVTNIGGGAIQNNVAGESGGVVYSQRGAFVDAGEGVVLGNRPETAVSRGDDPALVQVTGSLVLEAGESAAISIEQEPSSGTENVPLPTQPRVSISGAQEGHELPVRVVAVKPNGDEVLLEGPFNVVFDDDIEFQDIALPFVAQNVSLRFELIATPCNSTDPVVLGSASTQLFNVSECAFPAPAVCPNDIEVVNKQHECSAFVHVPAAFSRKCSDPLISHDVSDAVDGDELDPREAVGEYPVGLTFVTYTLANSLGVEDTCQVRVTVVDTEPPVLSCPEPVTVFTDEGQCGAAVQLELPEVEDNCDPGQVALSRDFPSSFFPLGTTTVTFRGLDDAGNVGVCSTSVTVVDDEAPTIQCPGAAVVGCGALPSFQAPVGTDNCPGAQTSQLTGPTIGTTTPLPPGLSTFTFEVVDGTGERATCTFSVTTEDAWYLDADGDGIGAGEPIVQCPAPGPNYVADKGSDCNDNNPNLSVWRYPDADRDGFGNSLLPQCTARLVQLKRGVPDDDTAPLLLIGGDCNDRDPLINPNQIELCNGVDDNCDGRVDEGCTPPAPPPSVPSIPQPPLAPEPPLPSEATVIILPTPLPRSPASPVEPVIIVQPAVFTDSAASALSASAFAALVCAALALLW